MPCPITAAVTAKITPLFIISVINEDILLKFNVHAMAI
jgi:hypothetical protein